LTLLARLAVALRLFSGYCARCGIDHPEVTAYFDSLWDFMGVTPGNSFGEWEGKQPPLVLIGAGLVDKYPPGFEEFLAARGIPERAFRQALSCATEVLYSSMYCASDEVGSRQSLVQLAAIAGSVGEPLPDLAPFARLRWSVDGEWSKPSAEEIAIWRYGGLATE
jgi:hypothetical protein